MSIFSRFSTMIKSNINDLISRAEDPEKMLNQIIIDMRAQLAKAKREVAGAIADERKLQRQLADASRERGTWEKRAMLAVQQGRDDLAKQALVRQQEHAEQAAALEQTWQAQAAETEKLKGSLRQLNEKIEEARRKRNLLIAKQKRAQAQRRIHETMSGLSDTSAFEAFNRMAEKIEEEERRNLAQAEINEALTGDTLETEFVRLESGSDAPGVDDKLLALKAKMGLIAAPEAEAPKQLAAGREKDGASEGAGEESDSGAPPIRDTELIEEFEKLEQGEGGP